MKSNAPLYMILKTKCHGGIFIGHDAIRQNELVQTQNGVSSLILLIGWPLSCLFWSKV